MPRKLEVFFILPCNPWPREGEAPFPGYLANFVVIIDYLYVRGPTGSTPEIFKQKFRQVLGGSIFFASFFEASKKEVRLPGSGYTAEIDQTFRGNVEMCSAGI